MRERLIELIKEYEYDVAFCDICDRPDEDCAKCGTEMLAEYLLENGVIVPPCKVGDKVYFIGRNSGKPIGTIDEIEIVQIAKTKDGFNAKGRFKGNLNEFEIRSFKIDNYSFFLTKEEAEAALKGGEKG